MEDPNDLISVYDGENVTEAYLVKNLLVDEGIQAEVNEVNEPLASLPISAPTVVVRRADETQARAIIDAYDEEQMRRAARPDWKCAGCGATVVGAFDECDVCGADRPGSEVE